MSHTEPPPFMAAAAAVKMSAPATGVPNMAPMVPDAASMIVGDGGIAGTKRANRAISTAMLIAMIGFSGPRLTPTARPRTSTIARSGSVFSGSGGATSSVVAVSGPPCPGMSHSASPTATPVAGQHHDRPPPRIVGEAQRGRQGVSQHALQRYRHDVEELQHHGAHHTDDQRRDRHAHRQAR
ncbi:hypothetical protein GCM10025773_02750 [Microbacterium jejuense]